MKPNLDRKTRELARLRADAEARRSRVEAFGDDDNRDLLADTVRMIALTKLKPNPINAMYFESLAGDDLARLEADIRDNGILDPLVAMRDGTLLTGHNRLEIARRIGLDEVPVRYVTRELSQEEQRDRIIADNLLRRHLDSEQHRRLITEMIKLSPEKSDRQISVLVKASPTTVGSVRKKLEEQGDVSKLDTSMDTRGRIQPRNRKAPTVQSGQLKAKGTAVEDCAGIRAKDEGKASVVSSQNKAIDSDDLTKVLTDLLGQAIARLGHDDPRVILKALIQELNDAGFLA